MKRLWSTTARVFWRPAGGNDWASRLQADPIAPRRLEPRRLLDGGVALPVIDGLDAAGDAVQAGEADPGLQAGGEQSSPEEAAVAALFGPLNRPPSNLGVANTLLVAEDGTATLFVSFSDPNLLDRHTLTVDWGDGSPVETIDLARGTRFVVTDHQYLDDNPTGTRFDFNQIEVTITDNSGESVSGSSTILVLNRPPTDVISLPVEMIDENSFATLRLSFEDRGTLDTHTVEIDWGDGSPVDTIELAPGARSLVTTHQYLDDNPSGTPEDTYGIRVRVIDDDGGVGRVRTQVLVKNVAPSNVTILPVDMIDEDGFATLRLTFDDPGTEDTHEVEIDWGDGTPVETVTVAAGSRSLVTTHQYLDDNPTGTPQDTYDISVRVIDDDTGFSVADATVLVKNVAPSNVTILPVQMMIDDVRDPGTEDTHEVEIRDAASLVTFDASGPRDGRRHARGGNRLGRRHPG